jgi:hypothetical protein
VKGQVREMELQNPQIDCLKDPPARRETVSRGSPELNWAWLMMVFLTLLQALSAMCQHIEMETSWSSPFGSASLNWLQAANAFLGVRLGLAVMAWERARALRPAAVAIVCSISSTELLQLLADGNGWALWCANGLGGIATLAEGSW